MIEKTPLLVLAKDHPLRALHVSGGRLQRVYEPGQEYAACYIPGASGYTVLLNEAVPAVNQRMAMKAIVRHHAEGHAPTRVHVFYCNRPRSCEDCAAPIHRAEADDHMRRTMRRLNWG